MSFTIFFFAISVCSTLIKPKCLIFECVLSVYVGHISRNVSKGSVLDCVHVCGGYIFMNFIEQ